MKRIAALIIIAFFAVSCGSAWRSKDYLAWMYQYMPLIDSLGFSEQWWLENIDKTLEVREKMGWNVPEREFRHFVLPLRVNNEYLDDFRLVYADTLCRRVQGMSMEQAALEINHWCYEQATYRGSDARTFSPMATARRGLGRCGEESVLVAAALRAAGLPARQVYTPRWGHTDDNHAWVEVWVDGKWHFMGACEPEAVLDLGWFNAPVSRALVLTTNVFGDYDGPESVIAKNECYTVVNLIDAYVPSRHSSVIVVDTLGRPVEGAKVYLSIYNYAEMHQVAVKESDEQGRVSVDMGLGAMFARAEKGEFFGLTVLDSQSDTLVLEHRVGEEFSIDLDLVPPSENALPSDVTDEQVEANKLRLKEGDAIRLSHDHSNTAVDSFKTKYGKEADALLNCLMIKDLDDVTYDVLEDAALNFPSMEKYVLGPRVELEHLLPFRAEVRKRGLDKELKSYADVDEWVMKNVRISDVKNPHGFRIPPVLVLKGGRADKRSAKIFRVALCRAVGLPAWLDRLSGDTSMELSEMSKGGLKLGFAEGETAVPEYYRDFTVSKYVSGRITALQFAYDDELHLDKMKIPELEAGYYYVLSGKRLSDGTVLARMEFFNINKGKVSRRELKMRSERENVEVLSEFDPSALTFKIAEGKECSLADMRDSKYFILAVLGENDEPSMHASRQLVRMMSDMKKYNVVVLAAGSKSLDGYERVVRVSDEASFMQKIKAAAKLVSDTRPVVVLCDAKGKVYCTYQGYNPAMSTDLYSCLDRLKR